MPNENTLMQKVIKVEDIEKYLNGTYTQVGGFVTRAIDVENIKHMMIYIKDYVLIILKVCLIQQKMM